MSRTGRDAGARAQLSKLATKLRGAAATAAWGAAPGITVSQQCPHSLHGAPRLCCPLSCPEGSGPHRRGSQALLAAPGSIAAPRALIGLGAATTLGLVPCGPSLPGQEEEGGTRPRPIRSSSRLNLARRHRSPASLGEAARSAVSPPAGGSRVLRRRGAVATLPARESVGGGVEDPGSPESPGCFCNSAHSLRFNLVPIHPSLKMEKLISRVRQFWKPACAPEALGGSSGFGTGAY